METGTNIENTQERANASALGRAKELASTAADGPAKQLASTAADGPTHQLVNTSADGPTQQQASTSADGPTHQLASTLADGPANLRPDRLTEGLAARPLCGLILYDGVCGLCNHFVKIVLDRDPEGRFQFASLQSELGQSILTSMDKDPTYLNTIYLVKGYGQSRPQILSKAKAALDIFGQLEGPVRFLKVFSFLPLWLLNLGYDLIAANRYRFFGKLDVCPVPDPAHLKRFLDQ